MAPPLPVTQIPPPNYPPPPPPSLSPFSSPNPPTTAHSLSQQPHATTGPPAVFFLTAAAVPAPAGAFSIFPRCRSSARSSRSLLYISPLPQQCPLQQEPFLYFPHCRSSARSSRSLFCISPLPQQCPLQQEPFLYFPTAAAVPAPAGAFSTFPHCRSSIYPHLLHPPCCHSSTHFSRSLSSFLDAAVLLQAVSSIPSALSHAIFGGLLATIWLLSHDKHFLGSFWVRAKCRARTPLPGRGEYPGLRNDYRTRSPLLGQHAKYSYRLFSSLYVSVNS